MNRPDNFQNDNVVDFAKTETMPTNTYYPIASTSCDHKGHHYLCNECGNVHPIEDSEHENIEVRISESDDRDGGIQDNNTTFVDLPSVQVQQPLEREQELFRQIRYHLVQSRYHQQQVKYHKEQIKRLAMSTETKTFC